ncbi:2'-5' RNA ligase family protein [Pontibacter sp. MBLB2868]|uniref:2'-5' RNA ligase family protein n=1 Tax=Pontibacter sp. MBLB2868 TaxID=3451555 RepID=UPI003F74E914
MDLKNHYDNLFTESSKEILQGNYTVDDLIDSSSDNRFGITLLIRPTRQIKSSIQAFMDELKAANPTQYYYPLSDVHITVMSIISCYSGFRLEDISVEDYVTIIEKCLEGINAIEINFHGVTASASAIMLQGFPGNNSLNQLRDNLRKQFKSAGLQETIDSRYTIATAHATVMRFRESLHDRTGMIQILEKYRNHNFGTFTAKHIELVFNDWYQRERYVKQLHTFRLK